MRQSKKLYIHEVDRSSEDEKYLPKTAQLKTEERAQQKRLSKIEKNGYLRIILLLAVQETQKTSTFCKTEKSLINLASPRGFEPLLPP